ncbi:MAG: 16S rRNA (uracil(1498)-N(3))-methyltransferase [Oleispira sp.]|nr:16S rRNA (uracil(1498)-N(3))-methyltransferase [Oleispira sp.]
MAIRPRIYTYEALKLNSRLDLDVQGSNHLIKVLRLKEKSELRLFNGDGCEYLAKITTANKKNAQVEIIEVLSTDPKISLPLHLGQVISKGDRMDFTVQKATELGITDITPLWSERCDVRLKGERLEKKMEHWKKVAISACEQSGRNHVPTIHPAMNYRDWALTVESETKLVLHPRDQKPLGDILAPKSVALLVGPEGGMTDEEVEACIQQGFTGLMLGPRVLRTETAALAALSLLQYLWGDF